MCICVCLCYNLYIVKCTFLQCTIQWAWQMYTPNPNLTNWDIEHFSHPRMFPYAPLQPVPCPRQRQSLLWFLSLSISLTCSRTTQKWSHSVCTLLCLTSFTQYSAFSDYPCCCIYQHFIPFLLLDPISLYDYSIIYSSVLIMLDICIISSFIYYEQSFHEHLCTSILTYMYFHFSWVNM